MGNKKLSWVEFHRFVVNLRDRLTCYFDAVESGNFELAAQEYPAANNSMGEFAVAASSMEEILLKKIDDISEEKIIMGAAINRFIALSQHIDDTSFPLWMILLSQIGMLSEKFAQEEIASN